jgi:leucyl/phenylalanyl-tRNA---protein transferase
MMPIYLLNEDFDFPDPELAQEDGLLAMGGDLSVGRILKAYENGIFPWFNPRDPILWWSPDLEESLFPPKSK